MQVSFFCLWSVQHKRNPPCGPIELYHNVSSVILKFTPKDLFWGGAGGHGAIVLLQKLIILITNYKYCQFEGSSWHMHVCGWQLHLKSACSKKKFWKKTQETKPQTQRFSCKWDCNDKIESRWKTICIFLAGLQWESVGSQHQGN